MKTIFFKLPEYYLLLLTILASYTPPLYINPIFIVLFIILILQIIFKYRISGILLGVVFFLGNLYFMGAVLSEFNEFNEFNSNAKQLLFGGVSIWILNLLFSLTMIYKYSFRNKDINTQIKLEKQSV